MCYTVIIKNCTDQWCDTTPLHYLLFLTFVSNRLNCKNCVLCRLAILSVNGDDDADNFVYRCVDDCLMLKWTVLYLNVVHSIGNCDIWYTYVSVTSGCIQHFLSVVDRQMRSWMQRRNRWTWWSRRNSLQKHSMWVCRSYSSLLILRVLSTVTRAHDDNYDELFDDDYSMTARLSLCWIQ